MSDAAVHLQSEYTFSPRVSSALYLRLCVLSCSSFALRASRLIFWAWIILWLVWAPLTSSGQRRHFASRAREYVVKYYTQLGLLQQPVIERWCSNWWNQIYIKWSIFLENISNNWMWIQYVQFFFSYSWQGSSFENQRSLAPWASPPPPPTKNESTVLMGGLFLLEHNLDERTLERKSQ